MPKSGQVPVEHHARLLRSLFISPFGWGETVKSGWTEAKDATLIRMWRQNAPLRDIAAEIGVSHIAVRARASRLQLPRKERPRKADTPGSRIEDGRFVPPAHIEAHKKARRGFEVPRQLEAQYIELLKTGIPISEVRQKLGL